MMARHPCAVLVYLLAARWPVCSHSFHLGRTPAVWKEQLGAPNALTFAASCRRTYYNSGPLLAKPKRGSVVESYQTVSVNCAKCRQRLFRYKKKNGTKSNLIKCFVERIVADSDAAQEILGQNTNDNNNEKQQQQPSTTEYACPHCQTVFARAAIIRGLPALKLIGGKTQMKKK